MAQDEFTGAPSVQTQYQEARAAQVDPSTKVGGIKALGDAFGNFFNNTQKTLTQLNSDVETERVQYIKDENKRISEQGKADAISGKDRDVLWSDRGAYNDAYTDSLATQTASQIGLKLQDAALKMPLDGSANFEDVAKKVIDEQLGQGTGDAQLDSLIRVKLFPTVKNMQGSMQEQVHQTVEKNMTNSISQSAVADLYSPTGFTTDSWNSGRSKFLSVTHGDTAQADKLMIASMAQGVQNSYQGAAVLKAANDSGWAAQNPEAYADLSEKVMTRMTHPHSFEAQQALTGWQADNMAASMNPMTPASYWVNQIAKFHSLDSQYGLGIQYLAPVMEAAKQAAKVKADVNTFSWAITNGATAEATAAHFGVGKDKIIDQSMPSWITQQAGDHFPELANTLNGSTGELRPLQDPKAVTQFVQMISNPAVRDASGAGMPAMYKTQMGQALSGNDPVAAGRAFDFYDQLRAQVGDAQIDRYFSDDEARLRYRAMKLVAGNYPDRTSAAKFMMENRIDSKTLADAYDKRDVGGIAKVLYPSKKPEEIQTMFTKDRDGMLLKAVGRDGFFKNPHVSMTADDENEFNGLFVSAAAHLKSVGVDDPKQALQIATDAYAKTRIARPGPDGNVILQRDTFSGAGRVVGAPLNSDPSHPYSVTKGYAPMYAPVPIKNAFGVVEDPLKLARQSLDDMQKRAPGVLGDSDGLYLGAPETSTGLSPVMKTGSLAQVQFAPGQDVAVMREFNRVDQTVQDPYWRATAEADDKLFRSKTQSHLVTTKVPSDTKEAEKFFRDTFGDGVIVRRLPSGAWGVYKGYTIEGTTAAAEKARAEKETKFQSQAGIRQEWKELTTGVGYEGQVTPVN
ncbi:hypothetical protein QCE62_00240 [Caballeronia sp. LZ033]|uniref:hypothetical protein n=1 Tax=Caballeronia sp. LZ033 TaxID=3038566 RepID=UPI002859650A|nr:hypothetical protein [Caballeronia sp. LZ033]MDR5812016.1 hypothetical protein [Caballeronia sp. LZ033]